MVWCTPVFCISYHAKQLGIPGIQQALLHSPGHLSHSITDLVTGRVCKADIQETPEEENNNLPKWDRVKGLESLTPEHSFSGRTDIHQMLTMDTSERPDYEFFVFSGFSWNKHFISFVI